MKGIKVKLVLLCIISLLYSCKDNDSDILDVDQHEYTFNCEGNASKNVLNIKSNIAWEITISNLEKEWVILSDSEGVGSMSVSISLEQNISNVSRQATLYLTLKDKQVSPIIITIHQEPFNILSKIKDVAFREFCERFDTNKDGVLTRLEAQNAKVIMNPEGVKSLQGIEYLSNLEDIYMDGCDLGVVDISKNLNLKRVHFKHNLFKEIDVSKNKELKILDLMYNQITSLDLRNNLKLEMVVLNNNKITQLDVSHNRSLISIRCGSNQLQHLDTSHNEMLQELDCEDNQLMELDLSKNLMLSHLYCRSNPSLDIIYVWDGFKTQNPEETLSAAFYDPYNIFVINTH